MNVTEESSSISQNKKTLRAASQAINILYGILPITPAMSLWLLPAISSLLGLSRVRERRANLGQNFFFMVLSGIKELV